MPNSISAQNNEDSPQLLTETQEIQRARALEKQRIETSQQFLGTPADSIQTNEDTGSADENQRAAQFQTAKSRINNQDQNNLSTLPSTGVQNTILKYFFKHKIKGNLGSLLKPTLPKLVVTGILNGGSCSFCFGCLSIFIATIVVVILDWLVDFESPITSTLMRIADML